MSQTKAGIKEGDIVNEFTGSPIASARELKSYIERVAASGHAVIKLRRNGKNIVANAMF